MRLVKISFILLLLGGTLNAQSWNFIREKDGILLYTRSEPNSDIKSYRGEVVIQSSSDRICNLIGNSDQNGWWAGTFSEVRILADEKGKYVRYYLVCPLPILLSDRDIVIETREMIDPASGNRIFRTRTLNGIIPENPDRVRIVNYFQTWTVEPSSQGRVRVSLEGSIDPGGNIPAWLTNQVMTNTPVRIINNLREWVMSGKPT